MMIEYPTGTLYYPQMGRSKSRSRSSSRSRSRSRSRSETFARKKSPSKYEMDNECKIYIGGLRRDSDEKELERVFSRYGTVQDVWIARSPPGFGFVELDDPDDASDAIRDLDGTMMCGVKVRVSHSCSRKNLPSVKGSRKPFDVRCYECGEFGHYAYECRERAMRLRRMKSYSRSRSRSPKRQSRSPKRGKYRSRSRSGSRGRRDRSRSRSGSRSKKDKKEKKKKSRSRSPSSTHSDDGKNKKKNYRKKHDSDSENETPKKKDKGKEKEKKDRKMSGPRH